MILQKEITEVAEKQLIPKTTVEKDWVLGHFLDGIFSVPELQESFVFKGGTCLRKCYFPDYRFSEDLDFTITDEQPAGRSGGFDLTERMLEKICKLVTERSGTLTHITSLKTLRSKDKKTGYVAVIQYWGADHPRNQPPPVPVRWQTRIKIETILYEEMVFPVIKKAVIHDYSDKLTASAKAVPCYSIEEILSEKIRALVQRSYTAPRDFYDIWFLTNNIKNLKHNKVVEAFHRKMAFKKLEFTGIDQLINEETELILGKSWKNSLQHQIRDKQLPDSSFVVKELKGYFKQILN